MDEKDTKVRKLTLSRAFAWIIGVILLLMGVTSIADNIVAGTLLIIASLILLPPTYSFISKKFNTHLSKGVRIVSALILFAIGSFISGSSTIDQYDVVTEKSQQEEAVTKQSPQEQFIEVTAYVLSKAYEDNTVAADQIYKDKNVRITGIIDDIGKDILDDPYVTFEGTQTSFFGVQCMFGRGNEGSLVSLSKGQELTVTGKVSGELIGNVLVKGCKVVE